MKKFLLIAAASMGMAASAQTVIAPPTVEEAEAAGFPGLWGKYDYGYVLPNGYQLVDNDEIKVVIDNGSTANPGANVGCVHWVDGSNKGSNINTNTSKLFDSAFYMGSAATEDTFEAVYSLEVLSTGIAQPYAIFNVEAKQGGELTLYSNRGNNKYTIYVWDRTVNEEIGAYVLASTIHAPNKEDVTTATVNLTKGHNYWIFGSKNNANIHMYALGFNSYSSPNYGYQGGESGIADVIVDAAHSDAIYNIMGQKVDSNYKGLVIKNGKKYIQK